MKEFHMIVVDNDTKEILGNVTDRHFYSLNISVQIEKNGIDCSFEAETIDELLHKSKMLNVSIYYMIGGVRIPVNPITHEKQYLFYVGFCNFTPAEAVIYGMLWESRCTNKGWLSTQELQNMLKVHGFTPTSLRMLLVNIRQKLEISESNLQVENKNRIGYRLTDPENASINDYFMQESQSTSDFWVLYCDRKLNYIVKDNLRHFLPGVYSRGSQILLGWQGLTHTEAEIFFELVKFRSQWVGYKHLLELPWVSRYKRNQEILKYCLHNFISIIRVKIANTDEVILNGYNIGYCLL